MIWYVVVGALILGAGWWLSEQLIRFGFDWWFISYHPYVWMGDIVKLISVLLFISILVVAVIRHKGNKFKMKRSG